MKPAVSPAPTFMRHRSATPVLRRRFTHYHRSRQGPPPRHFAPSLFNAYQALFTGINSQEKAAC